MERVTYVYIVPQLENKKKKIIHIYIYKLYLDM